MVDGVPVAMAEEERFSRKKHDSEFPMLAIDFVLKSGGIVAADLDYVVFYEKPFVKFERIMKTALASWPWAPRVFTESIKHLFLDKLWIRQLISSQLHISDDKVMFSNHHISHAASAFFASPFKNSAILTVDGVGEWATTMIALGEERKITILKEIRFPHSLGLLYSAFTAFLGFEVNEGEYKVMGMAPYGKPIYADKVRKVIRTFPDGSFALNLEYFEFHKSLEQTYSKKFVELFGKPRDRASKFFTRTTGWPPYFGMKPEGEEYDRMAIEQEYYADVAASVQAVLEEYLIKLANYAHRLTGSETLCMAGGVALNCVANWKIRQATPFKQIYIQPAAGDGGGALGAALSLYHTGLNGERKFVMNHGYFGAQYSNDQIKETLDRLKIKYEYISSEDLLTHTVAKQLASGLVVGWFHNRFEWGPRALGARSILADPRKAEMKDIVNTKIKFREPYRPFAPSVLSEQTEEYFDMPDATNQLPGRFMLYVVDVKERKRNIVPAITHVDGTARPQNVFKEESPRYWKLINYFFQETGVPLVMNTSFNLKGEPIVNTPEDAISTFTRSGMDILVLENYVIRHEDVPA